MADKVRVCVRLRPLLPSDREEADCGAPGKGDLYSTGRQATRSHISSQSNKLKSAGVRKGSPSYVRASTERKAVEIGESTYTFDHVFEPSATQAEVFRGCAADLVERSLAGENVTILAYGMTGSGKTHSMGTNATGETSCDLNAGIIPRFLNSLFNGLRRSVSASDSEVSFEARVAFLEIYNEKLIDLLNPETELTPEREKLVIVRERSGAMTVRGLNELPVSGCSDALEILHAGGRRRQTASTLMNSESSRSHAIFQVMVTRRCLVAAGAGEEEPRLITTTSKVSLVDLAGSERLKRTGAEGMRQREGISINYGLSVLGNVIKALCDKMSNSNSAGTSKISAGGSADHIPYRESLLTRLLQDSLGGNSRTLFLACLSPSKDSLEETLNTLRYANRAKNIKNNVSVNMNAGDRKLVAMQRKMIAFQNALVWQRFGPKSECDTTESPSEEQIKDLLSKGEVINYIEKIAGSRMTSMNTNSASKFIYGKTVDSHPNNSRLRKHQNSYDTMPNNYSDAVDHNLNLNDEETEVEQEAALDVMDRILEIELANQKHLEESSSENTELQSVEGELSSKLALLSQLREKLKARELWFQQMETERAKLEQDLKEAGEKAERAANEETAQRNSSIQAQKYKEKNGKKGATSKRELSKKSEKAMLKAKELESHVTNLRRKLVQNQKALRAMRRRQADEGALESQIQSLKQAKARILRSQKERSLRHSKAQKRREKELQNLRRKQRSDVRNLTKLKILNRNQRGILDRRAALLKRNQIALRNTRKQVVALLRQRSNQKRKLTRISETDQTKSCERKSCAESRDQEFVDTKFRIIENHINSMARMQCLRNDLQEELAAKEACVAELITVLSNNAQVEKSEKQDPDSIKEENLLDDDLVDNLQLKISIIEERISSISKEMEALEMSQSVQDLNPSQDDSLADASIDEKNLMNSIVSSLTSNEARAVVHMLITENARLQGNMMSEIRRWQKEQQEWRHREQQAHSKRLAAEHLARDLRLKVDLQRLQEDKRKNNTNNSNHGQCESGCHSSKENVDESEIQIELRMLQDEYAKLNIDSRLLKLSSKSYENDDKTKYAHIMESCSEIWESLGVPWKEREKLIEEVENSYWKESTVLLEQLKLKEQKVRSCVEELQRERDQICLTLGRKSNKLDSAHAEMSLVSQLQDLREEVEPMRMEIDERKYVLSMQRDRIMELSQALCEEEKNGEAFLALTNLDDASVQSRTRLLSNLLRQKSCADVEIHKVVENIRTQLLELCKGDERCSDKSRNSRGGIHDSAMAKIFNAEVAPLLKNILSQFEAPKTFVKTALEMVYSIVVTKETSPGSDRNSLRRLKQCSLVVTKICESLPLITEELHTLTKKARQFMDTTSLEPLCEVAGKDKLLQSSLVYAKDLLGDLEIIKDSLGAVVEEYMFEIQDMWNKLGTAMHIRKMPKFNPKINEDTENSNENNLERFQNFVTDISFKFDWEIGSIRGVNQFEDCLTHIQSLKSLLNCLLKQYASTVQLRKMATKVIEMEMKAQSFETEASDKNRLRAGGSRLLEEERFRRHFKKAYPHLLSKIICETEAWEAEHKTPLLMKNPSLTKSINESESHKKSSSEAVRLLTSARNVLDSYQEILAGSRVHKDKALTLGDLISGHCKSQFEKSDRKSSLSEQACNILSSTEANQSDEGQDCIFKELDQELNQENRLSGVSTRASIAGSNTNVGISPLTAQSSNTRKISELPSSKSCTNAADTANRKKYAKKEGENRMEISKPSKITPKNVTSLRGSIDKSICRSPGVAKTTRMVAERRLSSNAKDIENSAPEILRKKKLRRSKRTNLRDLFN